MTRMLKGNTPRRTIRVPEDLWQASITRAEQKDETVTDVVIRALKRYVRPREQS